MKGYRNGVYMGKTIKEGEHLSEKTQFGKGHIPWNKGLHKRLNTGRTHFSTEKNSREQHYNWKGGITSLSQVIRHLDIYHNWVKKIFIRDNYTCQECGQHGGNLEAHHSKSFSIILNEFLNKYSQFSPLEDKETLIRLTESYEPFWDLNNGKTLCKNCHNETKLGVKTCEQVR